MIRIRCDGFALLELAVWFVPLLPLAMWSASLLSQIHDDAVAKMLPANLIRETRGPMLLWRSDGATGVLEADVSRMRSAVEDLAARGESELSEGAWKLKNISAMACSWVVSIDVVSGDSIEIERATCATRGALAARLDLNVVVRSWIRQPIGAPLGIPGLDWSFADRRVLVGIAVVGEVAGLIPDSGQQLVSAYAVGAIREEVSL